MNTKRQAMSVDIFNTTLTITFSNGKDLSIDASALPAEIQKQAMLHGLKQKLVDAAAMSRNPDSLNSNQVDDKYAAVAEVHARLTGPNPTWNKERAKEGTPASANSLLVRALMQMTGRDKTYVDDFLTAKTKEQRAALSRNPRVLAIIAELKAATVSNGIDTDELLGELSGDVPPDEPETVDEAPAEPVNVVQAVQSAKPAPKARIKKAKAAAETV